MASLEGWSSTTELHLHALVADCTGFEPVISTVTVWHVRPLHQQSVAGLTITQSKHQAKKNYYSLTKERSFTSGT